MSAAKVFNYRMTAHCDTDPTSALLFTSSLFLNAEAAFASKGLVYFSAAVPAGRVKPEHLKHSMGKNLVTSL